MDDSLPSILCVDDDVDILDLLKEYFTEQGFVVLTATNGVEAFLQVKRWQPKAARASRTIACASNIRLHATMVGSRIQALRLIGRGLCNVVLVAQGHGDVLG